MHIEHHLNDTYIIRQTSDWIKSVVIGLNFCPFASKPFNKKTIRYVVVDSGDLKVCLTTLSKEFKYLDEHEDTETTFIILPNDFASFNEYLGLTEAADNFLASEEYEGIYQLASFHPQYCFAGSTALDAANYTNRSPYPLLHILREDSITKALENFEDPDSIPERNIDFAREKGLEFMKELLKSCM